MTVSLDLDADLAYVDGVQTVSVVTKGVGREHRIEGLSAVRGLVDRRRGQFLGLDLNGSDVVWELPSLGEAGVTLQKGDEVYEEATATESDDENREKGEIGWTVNSVTALPLGAGYAAACVKMRR